MAQNTTKNAWQLARVLHSVFASKKLCKKASSSVMYYNADYFGNKHHDVANEPFGGIMRNNPKDQDGFVMKRKAFATVLFACLSGKKKALTAAIEVLQAELDSSSKKKSSKIKWKDISPDKKDKKDKSASDKIDAEIFLG